MRKVLLLDDVFPTGEQTMQPAVVWHNGRPFYDAYGGITKHASEANDYIKSVVPEPGKTILLVLALGSEEAYGPNRNGDGFPERPVHAKHVKLGNESERYWIGPDEVLTKHYKTFEKGHAFQHHQNKDPAKASGAIKKAFWNNKMHRVELLVAVDNKKDPEWVQRVNDGEFPAVSMGCKIKYDVCSRCGNRAPSRATYCDHAKYALNQVNDDGTKNYVHNPSPNFFDLSRVFRPADRTGYTLKKVAHVYEIRSSAELGDLAEWLDAKSATIRKVSDIDKLVRGETTGSSSVDPASKKVIRQFRDWVAPRMDTEQPMGLVDKLSAYSPGVVLATLNKLGMTLSTRDCVQYMMAKLAGEGTRLDDTTLDRAVLAQAHVFDLFAESPTLLDKIAETGALTPTKSDDGLAAQLEPYCSKRAGMMEMMYRHAVPDQAGVRPEEAPTTDILTYTDPATGRTFRTSRGAALQSQDLETRNHFMKQLGGAGLMAGAYKMLGSHPLLALGGGALGAHMLAQPQSPAKLQTNEGPAISDYTEFAPNHERTASLVVSLVRDYQSLRTVEPRALAAIDSLLPYVKEGSFTDAVNGLELDLDVVASLLGRLIAS
jgi:ribosomal protein L40E